MTKKTVKITGPPFYRHTTHSSTQHKNSCELTLPEDEDRVAGDPPGQISAKERGVAIPRARAENEYGAEAIIQRVAELPEAVEKTKALAR